MAEQDLKWEELGGGIRLQSGPAAPFNEDSLLLAAFSRAERSRRACDFGTGCGIIPLLWCRRGAPAVITAVEQSRAAWALAQSNIEANGLAGRIAAVHTDLRVFWRTVRVRYDLVAVNPPYYQAGHGADSASPEAAAARQDRLAPIGEVCFSAARTLNHGGRLCLCFPAFRLCDAMEAMRANRLEPKRLRMVSAAPGRAPRLALIEGVLGGRPGLQVEAELPARDAHGNRSAAMEEYVNGGMV